MAKTCRTCAQFITVNEYFYLDGVSYVSDTLKIRDLLIDYIPGFDINCIPNAIICRNCMSTLHIAYQFKQKILKIEKENFDKNKVDTIKMEQEYEENFDNFDVYDSNDAPTVSNIKIIECPPLVPIDDKAKITDDFEKNVSEENIKLIDCPPLVPFDHRLELQESLSNNSNSNIQTIVINRQNFSSDFHRSKKFITKKRVAHFRNKNEDNEMCIGTKKNTEI